MGGLQFQLQMNWQPNLLGQRRKEVGPLGLKNLGNSCYLNSVLQCLTYTPPLANFCLRSQHSSLCDSSSNGVKKRDCPFCIIERRIARSLSSEVTLDTPIKIQSCLRLFADHFRVGCQEDAHEFLRYVIDACHNSCLGNTKLQKKSGEREEASTVVKSIFGGALQSQVKCLSCNSDSNKIDEIMDISLDVMHSNSVRDAMHKFFQPEVLDGNNKYKCEKCKKLVAARKQMSVLQAPNILVIQLKRFEGVLGKIDKAIAFQEVLLLSSFMSKSSKDTQPEYKLFGTIVHSGYSPESGHYYAYIKDASGRWYCCNDSCVSLSNLNDVLSEKVYILFFSRSSNTAVPKPLVSNSTVSKSVVSVSAIPNSVVSISAVPKSAVPESAVVPRSDGPNSVVSDSAGPGSGLSNGILKTTESCSKSDVLESATSKEKPDRVCKENGRDKRKANDECDELRISLEEESLVFLRKSGWYDEVYTRMRTKKRLCADEGHSKLELKKLVIDDARTNFQSKVPESLKQRLVERLRSEFFKHGIQ